MIDTHRCVSIRLNILETTDCTFLSHHDHPIIQVIYTTVLIASKRIPVELRWGWFVIIAILILPLRLVKLFEAILGVRANISEWAALTGHMSPSDRVLAASDDLVFNMLLQVCGAFSPKLVLSFGYMVDLWVGLVLWKPRHWALLTLLNTLGLALTAVRVVLSAQLDRVLLAHLDVVNELLFRHLVKGHVSLVGLIALDGWGLFLLVLVFFVLFKLRLL